MNQPFPESFTLRSGRSINLTPAEADELFDLLVRAIGPRIAVGTVVPSLPAFTAPLPLNNPWPANPPWYVGDIPEVKFTVG